MTQSQIIDAAIARLEAERDGLTSKLSKVDAQIEILRNVRILAAVSNPPSATPKVGEQPPAEANGTHGIRPTVAIRTFIRDNPGLARRAVIDGVSAMKLETKSENIRRALDSMLRQLTKSGKVTERDGAFFVEG